MVSLSLAELLTSINFSQLSVNGHTEFHHWHVEFGDLGFQSGLRGESDIRAFQLPKPNFKPRNRFELHTHCVAIHVWVLSHNLNS